MAVSLVKGQNIVVGLSNVLVGLGWDPRRAAGEEFDLDSSAFMLTGARTVRGDDDFVFYNQKKSKCGSVEHLGDNRTGEGEGDDEQILVNLATVPQDVEHIVFTVTIHKADERRQNFGQVDNAFIRIVDNSNNEEIARFDLTDDACIDQSMIFGELYRRNGEWKFKAIGQGVAGGLAQVAQSFGVQC